MLGSRLFKDLDVEPKLSANGVTKEQFEGALDEMVDLVYNDQCTPKLTPANHSLEEIRELLWEQF